jgi:hypothetical protein
MATPKYDGTDGAQIDLQEAIDMCANFRNDQKNRDKQAGINAFYMGSDLFKKILEQEGCTGIRMYHANDITTNDAQLVIVGVNNKGEDITTGVIADRVTPCPAECDANSALMK